MLTYVPIAAHQVAERDLKERIIVTSGKQVDSRVGQVAAQGEHASVGASDVIGAVTVAEERVATWLTVDVILAATHLIVVTATRPPRFASEQMLFLAVVTRPRVCCSCQLLNKNLKLNRFGKKSMNRMQTSECRQSYLTGM